jgi:hypothetical protein
MRRSGLIIACVIAFLFAAPHSASAGLLGVFQGKIVKTSVSAKSKSGSKSKAATPDRWLYVQSRNGSIRRVNAAKALVEYDEDVPVKQRHKNPAESLRLATEVRITAEQDRTDDGSGDWQAQHILILAPTSPAENKAGPRKTRPVSAPGVVTTL